MPNYLELPIGPKSPDVINAVIEIPLEGINKYEYDKELGCLSAGPKPLLAGALSRRLRLHSQHA